MENKKSEKTIKNAIQEILEEARDEFDWDVEGDYYRVVDGQEAGLLTRDECLIMKFSNGEEFVITIQKR